MKMHILRSMFFKVLINYLTTCIPSYNLLNDNTLEVDTPSGYLLATVSTFMRL